MIICLHGMDVSKIWFSLVKDKYKAKCTNEIND